MTSIKVLAKNFDWITVICVVLLMIIGVVFVYSSGVSSTGQLISSEYIRQIVWVAISLLAMFAVVLLDPKRFADYTPIIYFVMIISLVYLIFFGRVVNGARSWLGIGSSGIQPSEFMKIATILFLSKYLSSTIHQADTIKRFLISLGIIILPMLLILMQPDFGTALVFLPIYVFIAYILDVNKKYLAFLVATVSLTGFLTVLPLWQKYIASKSYNLLFLFYQKPYVYFTGLVIFIALVLAYFGFRFFKKRYYYWIIFISAIMLSSLVGSLGAQKVLKEYQVMRLIVFLDPSIDPLKSGWNIRQSITAIGSGGLTGKGFLQGTQSHYRYLPQQSTDFIFSIISEEIGLLGCLFIFSMFFIILFRMMFFLKNVHDTFSCGVVSGVFGVILFHFVINVGMAMGIMPITGIPLIFLSYGGSSLLAISVSLGLVLGISARRFST